MRQLLFYSVRIRTLVAMATYSSHILMMGKQFLLSHWRYLIFFSQICLLSSPPCCLRLLSKSLNLIGCRGGGGGGGGGT